MTDTGYLGAVHVCFSVGPGWLSRAVRWFTRARVSHTCIAYRDPVLHRPMVVEAGGAGFVLVPWRRWVQANRLVAWYDVQAAPCRQLGALRTLTERVGDGYDTAGALGLAARRWLGAYRNPIERPDRLFCSEAVATYLDLLGLALDRPPADYTPGDLLALCERRPEYFQPRTVGG